MPRRLALCLMSIGADFTFRRIVISVEYDGAGYRGWQVQKHDSQVVQTVVERALSRIADEPIRLKCSGRTDTGVHASSQICHFDTSVYRTDYSWVMGSNAHLPDDVCLSWATEVDPSFHARFLALSRQYVYLIRSNTVRSAMLRNAVTCTHKRLDPEKMMRACEYLIGTHDFNAYRSASCQAKTSVRTISYLNVHIEDELIAIHVQANAFLQHMVRNIVGVLMSVGAGDNPVEWAKYVLQSKDRSEGGVTAPPQGLYFLGPDYKDKFYLPPTVRIPQIAKDILKTVPVRCKA